MILEYLFSIPAFLVNGVISLLPASTGVPTEWTSAVYKMWSYVNAFSFIVPVGTLVFCLGTIMGFYLIIYGWDAAMWLLRKIPGVN